MLTENDVIEAVVSHLKHRGWAILSTCSTGRHGIDILAEKGGKKLAVEAKGGTSATLATKRYGKPFTANQKRTHAAVALLTAAQVASDGEFSAGVAFPNDSEHIKLITRILPALRALEIQVFLIGQDLKICDLTSKAV